MTLASLGNRVVIIGGGLAGLSAAECLARHHPQRFHVTLLEAKRSVGGRAGSFIDPRTAESIDYCQHVAMGCCTNFLGLLGRNNLMQAMLRYQQLHFLHPGYSASKFAPSPWLPAPLHLARVVGQLRFLTTRQRNEIRLAMLSLFRTKTQSLRAVTAKQWLESQSQSRETIARFWDVILTSALGDCSRRVAMSAARKVFVDGFAAAKGASDLFVPDRALSILVGKDLSQAIADLGVHIRLQTPVQEVLIEGTKIVGVKLSSGERIDADYLISAVPWHAISRLFDSYECQTALPCLEPLTQIQASPISGIHLWLDREITDLPHAVLVGTTAQWLFKPPFASISRDCESQTNAPRASQHYYQIVISAAHALQRLSKPQIIQQVLSDLRSIFPKAAQANVLRYHVVTDPLSVFSIRPEVETIRPPAPCPALPRLALAGDWTNTSWPATMEGAVISGIQAASCIAQSAGLSGIDPDPGLPLGWLARWLIAN